MNNQIIANTIIEGNYAPLIKDNVDTDQIIPSSEMKLPSKRGLGIGLFANQRYNNTITRDPNPLFILNQPNFQEITILVSGLNFGCGSSREHAVWALKDFGIKCIIAISFGRIFYENCIANLILPIIVSKDVVLLFSENTVGKNRISIDIDLQIISTVFGKINFNIEKEVKNKFILGEDSISSLLNNFTSTIDEHERKNKITKPWLF